MDVFKSDTSSLVIVTGYILWNGQPQAYDTGAGRTTPPAKFGKNSGGNSAQYEEKELARESKKSLFIRYYTPGSELSQIWVTGGRRDSFLGQSGIHGLKLTRNCVQQLTQNPCHNPVLQPASGSA